MTLLKSLNFKSIFTSYLGILAFGSLVFPKQTGLFIILLIPLVFYGYAKQHLCWKWNNVSILFISFYVAYIIGILFANDLSIGLKYAEYKLAFLLLPILLSFQTKFEFNIRPVAIGLVFATIVLGIYGLENGFKCYEGHDSNWIVYCFSSSIISPIHHPTYYSCFLLFAVITAWYGYNQKWNYFKIIPVIVYSFFGIAMFLLCLSMAMLLFFGIMIGAIFIYLMYKKFGKWLAGAVLIGTMILFPLILLNVPHLGDDLKKTATSASDYFESPKRFLTEMTKNPDISGNQKRLIMWTVTIELIKEHPFGVGTGNVDDYIDPRLEKYGFHELVEEDLNPHNQFLQTTLEIGVFGGLILLLLLGSIIWIGIKYKSYLLVFLGASLTFNSLFESMLQQQSGIIFYTFWSLLVMAQIIADKQSPKESITLP